MIRSFTILVLLSLFSMPTAISGNHKEIGKLANPHLTETSGIAVSRRYPDQLWGINDSGHPAELFAFSTDGRDLGTVNITGARNIDWEDLASFSAGEEHYLLIADTGDNLGRRQESTLYVVREPRRDGDGRFSGSLNIVTTIRFSYEGGPQDCEAVAVDAADGAIILIAKRQVPAPVFLLRLDLDSAQTRQLARRVGTVNGLPRATASDMLGGILGPWRHQPTGLDFSQYTDNDSLAVLSTYQALYVYRRRPGENWAQTFNGQPRVLRNRLAQVESVAAVQGGLIAIPEGRDAPVQLFPLR